MKTTLVPANPPAYDEVEVGCGFAFGKVYVKWQKGTHVYMREFDPAEAAKMHRVLMGELNAAHLKDGSNDDLKIYWHEKKDGTDEWRFCIENVQDLFVLDADQALALAWGIEGACAGAVCGTVHKCRQYVWVLASKQMLTEDCAENGSEQLGGCERVFSTKEKAMNALREFMRPLVNACHTESHWEKEELQSKNVDDVLDEILDDYCTDDTPHGDHWSYDGTRQSFVVTLSKVEVEV